MEIYARPIDGLDINASYGYYSYTTDVAEGDPGYVHPDYRLQAEHTANLGAQYSINFDNGSMLIPRVDVFYEGERDVNLATTQPLGSAHEVPDYTRTDARLTYVSSDLHWSLSLGVENLFDKLYWISKSATMNDDLTDTAYPQIGQPGRPRTISLSLRYDIFD